MLRREEEEKKKETEGHKGGREEGVTAVDVSAEVKTPVAFVPQYLPVTAIDVEIPSSIMQDIESSLETFINIPSGAVSPALSISTVSDLTSTELGEEIEDDEKQRAPRLDTVYFEDGNVEIECGETVFRVHSSVISFSSSKLGEIISQPALRDAPTPEGLPRITISDTAEDFLSLLKMIYTPWLVSNLAINSCRLTCLTND